MAKFIWKNGNEGRGDMHRVEKYLVTDTQNAGDGKTLVTMVFDEENYGSADGKPEQIQLVVRDLELSGDSALSGGVITRLQAFIDDKVVYTTKGLSFDIGAAIEEFGSLRGWQIIGGGHTFVGAKNSRSPDGWNGDDMAGGYGDDMIKAGGGDDYISGSTGNDNILGGGGWNVLDYRWYQGEDARAGLVVNAKKGVVTNSEDMRDTFKDIQEIRGTLLKDRFIGEDGEVDRFVGHAGNDVINGGAGGGDSARYHRDARYGGENGINANLKKGKIKDGFGDIDKVKEIENVRGTDYRDKFVDDAKDNGFQGEGGNDSFVFTKGNDWAEGGEGADRFTYKGEFGYDWIGDFNQAEGDRIKIAGAGNFRELSVDNNDDGNAVIGFGGNSITLAGIDASEVDASYFIF